MGIRWVDQGHAGVSPEIDEDFFTARGAPPAPEPTAVEPPPHTVLDGFMLPTPDKLRDLEPGCFVLYQTCEISCWAEVLGIEQGLIRARLHPELSVGECQSRAATDGTATFGLDAIRALGCERYCWC